MRILPAVLAAMSLLVSGGGVVAQEFYGEILLKPVDGVMMEVQQPFGFIDARSRKWEVPAKYKTDGASIPRPLWSIVGSPFTGNYLAAAIIHDFYCDLKSRTWKEVHSAFFDAMIAKKVDSVQAKVMYYAVYRFGPRWIVDKHFVCPPGVACSLEPGSKPTHVKQVSVRPIFDESEFRKIATEIEKSNPSLAKIRSGADSSFYGDDRVFDIKGEVDPPGQRLSIDQQGHLQDVPGLRGSLKYLLQSSD